MRGTRLVSRLVASSSLSIGLALVTLAGCVVAPVTPAPRGILVNIPPPALIREERTPAPAPLAAWVAGYWHWTGLQYAWIPGHWEAAPPLGSAWRAPVYAQNNGAYFYEPGGWAPVSVHSSPAGSARPASSAASREAFH